MGSKRVVDFIQENLCVFRTLTVIGHVPASKMNEYKVYLYFQTLEDIPSKMQRYADTAQHFNISEVAVMRAVKAMETKI